MSDTPCRKCDHIWCKMQRGEVLPGWIARIWWDDGTLYVPSPEAQANHDAAERAREEAERIETEIAKPWIAISDLLKRLP